MKKQGLTVTDQGKIPFPNSGVDKGWDYQPGVSVAADLARLKKMEQDKLKRLGLAGGAVMEDATQKRDRLFEEARRDVVEHGRKTGNERLVLLDAKTGEMLDAGNGSADEIMLTDAMMVLINDSRNAIDLIHNHPESLSFSKKDLLAASRPGVNSIEAIGHDKSWYKAKPKTADFNRLGIEISKTSNEVANRLGQLVSDKKISLDNAGKVYHHIVNLTLAQIGFIDYEYSSPLQVVKLLIIMYYFNNHNLGEILCQL